MILLLSILLGGCQAPLVRLQNLAAANMGREILKSDHFELSKAVQKAVS